MNIQLVDTKNRTQLFPLTFTRPIASLRVGILTIAEKWEKRLNAVVGFSTEEYLSKKYPACHGEVDISINGSVLPDNELVKAMLELQVGQGLRTSTGVPVAVKGNWQFGKDLDTNIEWQEIDANFIQFPEEIFAKNAEQLAADYHLITNGRTSQPLSDSNKLMGKGELFIEPGAIVEGALINPNGGFVYIGKDAEVMQGSMIYGSLALCDHSTLKMGAKIYGATTVGPYSKIGGEVSNSVVLGYSNKGHDGFLGNSVIGEWCNLGADTNNSNLKNNYAEVKLWDYTISRFRSTGLQFCGLIMGDHSKCGINTMFNTGTVVGICSNIFGSGFPRNFVPSFAWGGSSGFTTYQLNKVFETGTKVYERRSLDFDDVEKAILTYLFNETSKNRFWEDKKSITI